MSTNSSALEITLSTSDKKIAVALLRRSRAQYVSYLEDCEDDRRNGYRPHYCRHGVSQWVDYDCACWQCEEYGNYWDYLTELTAARDTVYRARLEVAKRRAALAPIRALGGDVSALIDWVIEPMTLLM
jgi:hypothetical protein